MNNPSLPRLTDAEQAVLDRAATAVRQVAALAAQGLTPPPPWRPRARRAHRDRIARIVADANAAQTQLVTDAVKVATTPGFEAQVRRVYEILAIFGAVQR